MLQSYEVLCLFGDLDLGPLDYSRITPKYGATRGRYAVWLLHRGVGGLRKVRLLPHRGQPESWGAAEVTAYLGSYQSAGLRIRRP